MSVIRTFNVEAGLPTLDEARRLVIEEIKQTKRAGARVLKVIHRHGSSGKAGTLGVALPCVPGRADPFCNGCTGQWN